MSQNTNNSSCSFHRHHFKQKDGSWKITTHNNDFDCSTKESVMHTKIQSGDSVE